MCGVICYHGGVYVLALCVITSTAITNVKDKDGVNTNALGDEASHKGNLSRHKDGISRETIEKRTFAKPDFDRRGSFYPSGHGFHVGTSIDVGEPGPAFMDDRNFHTSGNGYSYGTPNAHYPPVWYSPSYPPAGPGHGGYGPPAGPGHGGYAPPAGPGHGGYGPPGFGVPSFGGPGIGGFGGGGHSGGGYGGHGGHDGGGYGGHGGHDGGGYGGHGGPSVGGGHPHAVPLKGLLIPIAGVALLGAAAALAKTHPVLLQLGVISGKRKRSLDYTAHYPSNPYARPNFNSIS